MSALEVSILLSVILPVLSYMLGRKTGVRHAIQRAARSEWPAPRPRLQPRPPPLDISQALHGDRIICTTKACDPRCHIRNPRLHVGARHNHE